MIRNKIKYITLLSILIIMCSCSRNRLYRPIPDIKPPSPIYKKDMNIALVLGGGGAKGFFHLGVIEVLEENHIPIDLIVGTSAGSLVGALYADSKNIQTVKEKIFKVNKWDLLDVSVVDGLMGTFSLNGTVSGYQMQKFFYNNLTATNFNELKIPFIAVAVDAKESKGYILDSGPVAPAIVASSSIPPVFAPLTMYNHELTDGGAIYPVPVEIAKRYNPKMTISVDICSPADDILPNNMPELTYKVFNMSYHKLCRLQSEKADIDINPDTTEFSLFDNSRAKEMYKRGRKEALSHLPKIKKLMKLKHIKPSLS